MDLKSFAAGVLAGGVAVLLVSKLLNQNDTDPSAPNAQPPEASSTSGSTKPVADPSARGVPRTNESESASDPSSIDTQYRADATNSDQRASSQDLSESEPPIVPYSVPITEAHRKLIGSGGQPDKDSGNPADVHAALDAEPRDYEWSYFMEQSLRQFLGNHAESTNFDVIGVECRTTLCQIQAIGIDENVGPRWGLMMHDLGNQAWSDFGQTGTSSSTIDGRQVIITHLHRLSDPL